MWWQTLQEIFIADADGYLTKQARDHPKISGQGPVKLDEITLKKPISRKKNFFFFFLIKLE